MNVKKWIREQISWWLSVWINKWIKGWVCKWKNQQLSQPECTKNISLVNLLCLSMSSYALPLSLFFSPTVALRALWLLSLFNFCSVVFLTPIFFFTHLLLPILAVLHTLFSPSPAVTLSTPWARSTTRVVSISPTCQLRLRGLMS